MMFIIGNNEIIVYHCSPILSECLFSQNTYTNLIKKLYRGSKNLLSGRD